MVGTLLTVSRGGYLITAAFTRSGDLRYSLAWYWLDKANRGPWYGQGLRSFQMGDAVVAAGAHNQFIMVYGEVGIVGFLTYLLVLGGGLRRAWTIPMIDRDRLIVFLLWSVFPSWHFKGHGLFGPRECVVIVGLLYMAPYALKTPRSGVAGRAPFRGGMRSAIR